MKELIKFTRQYRESLLKDKYRPAYHFAILDGDGRPGDPNGAFYADGRYHLMYLYKNYSTNAYHWGHLSSLDLLHWREHPDALTNEEGDTGCFSGGAFVDDDGIAYLSYWKFPSLEHRKDYGGIEIAYSKAPYEKWERMKPIAIESEKEYWGIKDIIIDGKIKHVACADPSNIWKMNGWYYMQAGNLPIIERFGKNNSEYACNYTDLFKSKNLRDWQYVGKFYTNPSFNDSYPDETEDDMCPSFLPLYDKELNGNKLNKYLQLFISHNKGAQYFIGSLDKETFIPYKHGRFSWKDNFLFAPEALVDNKNRQIVWFWLLGNNEDKCIENGWSGVFSFPRVLWLDDDVLKMAPAEELNNICYNEQKFDIRRLSGIKKISLKNGESFRIKSIVNPLQANKIGFRIRASSCGKEYTDIYVDLKNNKLVFDADNSSLNMIDGSEEAPFELVKGEQIKFDIFVDKSIVEVYVNNRQAICRRIYPSLDDSIDVYALADDAEFLELKVFEVSPTNLY